MMATIKIKNKSRNFMFFGSVTLTGREEKTLDTSELNDKEIATLVNAIAVGSLVSDTSIEDLIKEIKDPAIKKATLFKATGESTKAVEFKDVEVAPVIIEEVETEADEVFEESAKAVEEAAVETTEEAKEEANLESLLAGSASEVKKRLKEVKLDDDQKLKLVELEQADKNRASVLDLILSEGA